MLVKLGEAVQISSADIQPVDMILVDAEITDRCQKFASELKTIAPAAKDFLYFTAVMMHAAEAALLESDGSIKKDASGNLVEGGWKHDGESVKWFCSDPNVNPYKNANADIFPEEELLKAHKKWIGCPLCLDHKSSSVDMIRGVIVDTYYDRKHKRVVALCALDKINYPSLARQVSTGYATSVSMGTAVGRAVCSDCGKVARVESDFCSHMRNKSCYGEINLDLSPIELSIVVNGADPQAKIKHIIAKDLSKAADHISEYMKLKLSQGDISSDDLESIKKDLEGLTARFGRLVESARKNDSNETDGPTTSSQSMIDREPDDVMKPLPAPPSDHLVDWATHENLNNLNLKLASMQEDLQKLMITKEEPTMMTEKKGYFQGAGGPNEPTPGRPQYEKENYETIRNTQDKQMVGQPPFPGTGPVDGMHPGYSSFGESEEARKKRLQRLAEGKERQMRRQAALEKAKELIDRNKVEGYFHGGGGLNEPTPGKRKYDIDALNEKARKEDKHMVGQSPFPDVGPVDGLHPSPASADTKDEEKRKEMLARAALKAKFVKSARPDGTLDLGNSCWQVFAGKNLILSASVNEITRGNSDAMYDSVATKEFGLRILNKLKTEGFNKTHALLKQAQPAPGAAPAQAMGAPGTPADAMPAPAPMPGGADEPLPEPKTGGSDHDHLKMLAEEVRKLADETSKRADDLVDAMEKIGGESDQLEDVPPASEEDFDDSMPKMASVSKLQSMRKTLNGLLVNAMSDTIEALQAHADELTVAANIYDEKFYTLSASQRSYLESLTSDAVTDANRTLADSVKLLSAFVKYAHGTDSLLKRASQEAAMQKRGQGTVNLPQDQIHGEKPGPDVHGHQVDFPTDTIHGSPPSSMGPKPPPPIPKTDTGAAKPLPVPPSNTGDPLESNPALGPSALADDGMDENDVELDVKPEDLSKLGPEAKLSVNTAGLDLSTKAGRAQYRSKLAQTGVKFLDMLDKAHPQGGHTPGAGNGATISAQDGLARVEDLGEIHDEVMNLANMPPKVRKEAARIDKLVREGHIAADSIDELVAYGVDPATVKYWKEYYSQSKDPEAKQWAADLVKEHSKQKVASEVQTERVRLKRAYDLAYEMRDRGIIESAQVDQQVNEILTWNDQSFAGMKRIIAKQAMRKQAMPTVGLLHSGEVILPSASSSANEAGVDLAGVFESYFAGKKL